MEMMGDIINAFGFICLGAIAVSSIAWAASAWRDVKNSDCHTGLRNRISDTVADVAVNFDSEDLISRDELIMILKQLHNGYWPNIQAIACGSKARGKS